MTQVESSSRFGNKEKKYYDLRKHPEIIELLERMGIKSVEGGVPTDTHSEPHAKVAKPVALEKNPYMVTREEFFFINGYDFPDGGCHEINLMEVDESYQIASARLNAARGLSLDRRVENSSFLPDEDVRDPYIVSEEEFIFLFDEVPDEKFAVS